MTVNPAIESDEAVTDQPGCEHPPCPPLPVPVPDPEPVAEPDGCHHEPCAPEAQPPDTAG
ncbi:hypothetical protein [Streptacidiphilus fuscans]|uniref:Uncharacterized protein n=1 Tax=Streptacidiphilus fuscans TaxID=2789292 RepID=A0A931AYH4_9ACTN|nr:hypothetical protein [Streptacidiphilus fuscans]MBF9067164.1 hypothetical protein [Streptacidiphilus fuscans]